MGMVGTRTIQIPMCKSCTMETVDSKNIVEAYFRSFATTVERCAFCEIPRPCRWVIAETCDAQADGAIPNGRTVEKVHSNAGDTYADGVRGRVLGSVGPVDGVYGYYVAWAPRPRVPVFIAGSRVAEAK